MTPHPYDVLVGKRIRTLRSSKGITQAKLADAMGITFQQVQKYESGRNRISVSRLTAVATAIRVPLIEFFKDIPTDQQGVPLPLPELGH